MVFNATFSVASVIEALLIRARHPTTGSINFKSSLIISFYPAFDLAIEAALGEPFVATLVA
jgi:hypothetical protein